MDLSTHLEPESAGAAGIDVVELGTRAGQLMISLFEGDEWEIFLTSARNAGSSHSPEEIKEELAYLALHGFSTALILDDRVSEEEEFAARRVALAELQQSRIAPITALRYDKALHRFNVNGQIIGNPKEADESRTAAAFGSASLAYLVNNRDAQHLASGPRLDLWNMLAGFWLRTHRWWAAHLMEAAHQRDAATEDGDLLARYVIANVVVGRAGEKIVRAANSCRLNADRQLIYAETAMLALWAVWMGFASRTGDLSRALETVRKAVDRLSASSTWRTWVTDTFTAEELWKVFEVRLQQYGEAVKYMESTVATSDSASKASVAYSWAAGAILIHHLSRFAEEPIDLGDPTPEAEALLAEAAGCFYAGFANGVGLGSGETGD